TQAARQILEGRDIPLAFLSSHTDKATVELTEGITSYGYILKTSGPVVLLASIKMVFRLYEAREREQEHRRQLRESEARYRELFEQNPMPMWVYDLDSLKFLAVNDAAMAHYGYSLQEFLDRTIVDIRPPEEVERLKARVKELKTDHVKYANSGLWQHQKKDGTTIHVEIFSHGMDFQGRPARLILARDVTERLAAEFEVQRQLAEKERLLAQFYSRTRNHIAALEEMLKVRAREMQSEEGTRAILETMNRVSGLRLLYDQLLKGTRGDVSPASYLGDLGNAIFRAQLRATNVKLVTDLEEVQLSSNQILGLGAVTNELISETLRSAFWRKTGGTVFLGLKKAEEDIILSVADDGDPWNLDSWEKSPDSFGFSVMLMVAEQLGGSIGVEPDQGNRILFRFPQKEMDRAFRESISGSPLSERFRNVIEAVNHAGHVTPRPGI
ncbi:MAG TPA: hypothetical protein DEA96_14280, partial [Leptospiraceae bacterium]|nr:hypothetical protein [Leptospiraceae bacterium]